MPVIWFTGLPCSGKTTLANMLKKELEIRDKDVIILDGDELRKTISKDLGFSEEDRREHNRRVINLAKKLNEGGKFVIVALVSPLRNIREEARKQIGSDFLEVFLSCPLAECIKRDVKGMYKKALEGQVFNFTGIHQHYEEPINPELILYTAIEEPRESLKKIINKIKKKWHI